MSITNGYCSLAELKARLGLPASDTADDAVLEAVIEAASRAIDNYCSRRFFAAADTRYYTAEAGDILFIDDVISVSSLTTDDDGDRTYETTWATGDYDLEPYNAQAETPARPYTYLRTTPQGRYAFPTGRKGVKIVGSFGYASTAPDAIAEACLLQAARFFKRKDAPFGVAGSPDIGEMRAIPGIDPDVKQLLARYRKVEVIG